MTETLTAVAIVLALLAVGGMFGVLIAPRARPDGTYIDPRPQPPDWVNDAHHRRPRRGTWREDCTS